MSSWRAYRNLIKASRAWAYNQIPKKYEISAIKPGEKYIKAWNTSKWNTLFLFLY